MNKGYFQKLQHLVDRRKEYGGTERLLPSLPPACSASWIRDYSLLLNLVYLGDHDIKVLSEPPCHAGTLLAVAADEGDVDPVVGEQLRDLAAANDADDRNEGPAVDRFANIVCEVRLVRGVMALLARRAQLLQVVHAAGGGVNEALCLGPYQ